MKKQINLYYPKSHILVRDNIIIEADDGFFVLSGYSKKDIIGKNIFYVWVNLLKITCSIKCFNSVSTKKTAFLFTKKLESREVLISLKEDRRGIIVFMFREIMNSRIEHKFAYVERLISGNSVGVGIFAVTPEIILLKANRVFLGFFDKPFYKMSNAIGKTIQQLEPGWKGSFREEAWKEMLAKGTPFNLSEYKDNKPGKPETYWKINTMPIFDKKKIKYIVNVAENITESVLNRKYIEEQNMLIKNRKEELELALRMKEEFITIVSHELKTPLNVINGAIQVIDLLYGHELHENVKKHLYRIKNNVYRQMKLVNNVLDSTYIISGTMSTTITNIDIVCLTKSITESIMPYCLQKNIQLSFLSNVKKKVISTDGEKIERILLNLLSNAIKYTPNGKNIKVNIISRQNRVFIKIIDTGIGIPKEKQKIIFEKFGQVDCSLSRKAEGSGIGLYLVKQLVELLNGSIALKSELNKGSTFVVSFPEKESEGTIEPDYVDISNNNNNFIKSMKIELSDIYL